LSNRLAAWDHWTKTRAILVGLALAGLMTGCGKSKAGDTAANPTVAPTSTSTMTSLPAEAVEPTTANSPTTAGPDVAAVALPVSVESDAAMRAAGNEGPSSSILVPSSCTVTGGTRASATGIYRGEFVPLVYPRYGDVVDLYVFSAPVSGYPDGIQLAAGPFSPNAPLIAGKGSWTVTVSLDTSLGQPVRCMVAAQPTHDFEGAPSAF
jgi:hypothetical protein